VSEQPTGPFDGVVNFREMGGLPADGGTVKPGLLYRSGHWSQATDGDVMALADYDLAAVVDFRADIDRQGDGGPNRIPAGGWNTSYHQLPMADTGGNGEMLRTTLMSGDQALIEERFGGGRADELATRFVLDLALDEANQRVFARFIDVVEAAVTDGRPVLWHCSAGKDRAGWAATVLGMALGVPDEALIDHYEASNIHRPVASRLAYYAERGVDAEAVRPFLMVHGRYLRNGLAAIDERWADRGDYLDQALGLGPDRIAGLRTALIT
jgi:protein-tyrosine phosphatase